METQERTCVSPLSSAIDDKSHTVSVRNGEVEGSLAQSVGVPGVKRESFDRLSSSGTITINFAGLGALTGDASAVKAHGVEFAFMHELVHRFGFRDPHDFGDQLSAPGDVEKEVNKIRGPLKLPARRRYMPFAGMGLGTQDICWHEYVDPKVLGRKRIPQRDIYKAYYPCPNDLGRKQ